MNPAKWRVFRAEHTTQWVVWPPYTENELWFSSWRDAYDFAHRMAGGLA